jgi:hypothetical protein
MIAQYTTAEAADPGFRRGEGGWDEVEWAFMVARGEGYADRSSTNTLARHPTQVTLTGSVGE